MSRLIVEAVSGESKFVDIVCHLELLVSVSDAKSGAPVSGLLPIHFRLASPAGKLFDAVISSVTETSWDRAVGGTGCYSLGISISKDGGKQKMEWMEGEFYPFCIQVRYVDAQKAAPQKADAQEEAHMGQTVVRVQSLGK